MLVHFPVKLAPLTVPVNATDELFIQRVMVAGPAFTIGGSVKKTCMVSVTTLHKPLFVELNMSFIVPAAVSALDDIYCGLNIVEVGVKTPDPVDDHEPVAVALTTLPFNVIVALLPHIV